MATDLPNRDESRDRWIVHADTGEACVAVPVNNCPFPVSHMVQFSELEAALKRVGELELKARTACEWYSKWAETPDQFLWPECMESMRELESLLAQTEKTYG